ncbi:type III-A CRISPR-associated RAMP protein Csm5 [Methanocaldococcus sp.]
MEVKCTLKSPIFIGCGEEYSQLDYFIDKEKMANIVDLEKAVSDLDDLKKVDEISRLIIQNTINTKVDVDAKKVLERIGLNPEDYVIKKIKCEIKSTSKTRVKKFISQNNSYYIPGSSIKGAIRTAYIFNYYDRNFDKLVNILKGKGDKGKKVVEDSIGKIHEDFFKYLKISDSLDLDGEFRFIHTRRWSVKQDKRPKVPTDIEGMVKGTFLIDIKIEDEFFKNINKKLKTNYNPKDDEEKFNILKDLCNSMAKTVVEFELEREKRNKNRLYVEMFYQQLLNEINNNNALYLNLGFGGGFLNKTIYPLLWKHDKNNRNFNWIREIFINLAGKNTKLRKAWEKARTYLEFPTTRTFYSTYSPKDGKVIPQKPLGWIKIEMVE